MCKIVALFFSLEDFFCSNRPTECPNSLIIWTFQLSPLLGQSRLFLFYYNCSAIETRDYDNEKQLLGYCSKCTSEYTSNTKFLLMNLHSDEISLSHNGEGW